jgi:hypothetical protein
MSTDKMTEVKEKVNEVVQEAHTAANNAGHKTVETFKGAEESIKPYIEKAEQNVQLGAEKGKHAFEKTAEMTKAAGQTAIDKTKEASAAAAAKIEEITGKAAEGTKATLQRAENAI